MGAAGELDDARDADFIDQGVDISGVAGNDRARSGNVGATHKLSCSEFVADASDGQRASEAVVALGFELANNGVAIIGHGIADARDDGVEVFDRFALVDNFASFAINGNIAIFVLDDFGLVSTFFGLFD